MDKEQVEQRLEAVQRALERSDAERTRDSERLHRDLSAELRRLSERLQALEAPPAAPPAPAP